MSVDLRGFEAMAHATRLFWSTRADAASRQRRGGDADRGNRAGVTGGKNLDGYCKMIASIIADNGPADLKIITSGRAKLTLPGFFRVSKNWDLLALYRGKLLAAVEFKSQVGPSFGNNFNNRVEEAIGNAVDLLTAFREGGFGVASKPFIGFFFVLEDCDKSIKPVSFSSPHFEAFPEFVETGYANRYEILCRKLVTENLYSAASLALTPSSAIKTGEYRLLSEVTSPKRFVSVLAGHIAGAVA